MRTGESDTGLKACVYRQELRDGQYGLSVWIEPPDEGRGWKVVEFRPVSEGEDTPLASQ